MRDVHVWCANLELVAEDRLKALLSDDERARAARFRFDRDDRSFVARCGILRQLLSQYTGLSGKGLKFAHGEWGKPRLGSDASVVPIAFNVSSSRQLSLFAFSRCGELGVDIEFTQSGIDCGDLMGQVGSVGEAEAFSRLERCEQPDAFYMLWTRKEALLKAVGQGLHLSPRLIDVGFSKGIALRKLQAVEINDGSKRWTLVDLLPQRGFVGALAIQQSDVKLSCFRWQGFGDKEPKQEPSSSVG